METGLQKELAEIEHARNRSDKRREHVKWRESQEQEKGRREKKHQGSRARESRLWSE